jgi:hypothetical protein
VGVLVFLLVFLDDATLKSAGTSKEVGMVVSGESLFHGFNAGCGSSTAIGLRKMQQCARFEAKAEAARMRGAR